MLDEPRGRFGRWGQVASALATFGVLGFLIVFVVLDWLVGATWWVLLVACLPIALFSIAWGFTVVEDDEPESESVVEGGENLRMFFDKPKGPGEWIVRIVGSLLTFGSVMGLCDLLLIDLLGFSPLALALASVPVLALSFAAWFTGFDEDDDRVGLPENAPSRDGANARVHARARI